MKARLYLLPFLLCCHLHVTMAQLAPERAAWNNLGKERWLKASTQLKKALRKDSLNLGAHYALAWFYFSESNPSYNLDSASTETQWMLRRYDQLSNREKVRNLRYPFDSVGLIRLKVYIDSAAFERAKEQNTEESYDFFMDHFPTAEQRSQAQELMEETAFLNALKKNTYPAFSDFIARYPGTARAQEARSRYERLLYESKTRDKKLASYAQFLKQHPDSPFRADVEQQVFEIMTASGEETALRAFLKEHPVNRFSKCARDLLYHIARQNGNNLAEFMTDSLRKTEALRQGILWPVWRSGTYTFFDKAGKDIFNAKADSLSATLLCEGLNADVVAGAGKLVARNGWVLVDNALEITNLGYGFFRVRDATGYRIVHKSGRTALFGNAELIGHHFFYHPSEVGILYSLAGRKLLSGSWDAVVSYGTLVAFRDERGWRLASVSSIGAVANGGSVVFSDWFDEVVRLDSDFLRVRKADRWGLLTNDLRVVLPVGARSVDKQGHLLIVTGESGRKIFQKNALSASLVTDANNTWAVTKSAAGYSVIANSAIATTHGVYDSAWLLANVALAVRNDTTWLISMKQQKSFPAANAVSLLISPDSTFLLVTSGTAKEVVSLSGERLFIAACEEISYAGGGVFIVTRKENKMLVNATGSSIPLPDFDAIGNATTSHVSVLLRKKFGLLDGYRNRTIKPAYDRNLIRYNDKLIVAWKDGAYGLIDWNDKPVTRFEFEEVRFWNDSVALVKKNFFWQLFRITDNSLLPGRIKTYSEFTSPHRGESIAIFEQDNYWGVMSNRNGTILEPTYTSIFNIGTPAEPFFFTEKYIEEAEIHVVIYYNVGGQLVRRGVFEEAEYSKIVCTE